MTLDPVSQKTQLPDRSAATGPIVALVLLSAIGNFGGTLLFYQMPNSETAIFLLCCALGLMVAQPCALAVWCAMGAQKPVVRVPLTMGILSCLLGEYTATLYAMDTRFPLEIAMIIIAGPIVLAVVIQIPLWLFRFSMGFKLSPPGVEEELEPSFQFGIFHLLITTAIAAVIVAVSQYMLQFCEFDGGAPWDEILRYLVTFEVFVSVVTLVSFAFVFSRSWQARIGLLLGLVVMSGPLAVHLILDSISGGGSGLGLLRNTFGFTISLTTALTAVLFVFKSLGYRLRHSVD